MMKNRKVMGALTALLFAGLGTAALIAYVNGAEERATAGEDRVEVFLISAPIPAGTSGEDLEDYVEATLIPAKLRTEDSITTLAELEGMVASVELLAGEPLRASRFTQPEVFEDDQLRKVKLAPGQQEITISLAPERALGGQVTPGHTVGVYSSFDPFKVSSEVPIEVDGYVVPPNGTTSSTTHALVHKVVVTNVQLEQLPEVLERTGLGEEENQEVRLAPTGNLLVTLAVDTATAERIIFSVEFGRIWLTLEPADATEVPSQIWTREDIYQGVDETSAIQAVGG